MLKKILCIMGVLTSLLAAEGLHRIGSLVSAFDGGDGPIYLSMLALALFVTLLFILALVKKLPKALKVIGIIGLLVSIGIMFFAPALPVNQQIIFSLAVGLLCLFFAPCKEGKP